MRLPFLRRCLGGLLIAVSTASVAPGQWTLIDNFQSASVGPLGSQGGWTTSGAANPYQVANDPLLTTNKALQVSSGDQAFNAFIPLGSGINVGNTGTVFFRMRNGAGDLAFGASDLASPAGFGDFEGYMVMAANQFRVRDAGTNKNVGNFISNDWYNVWLVLDNDANQNSLYVSQGVEPAFLLGTGGFRTGNGDPAGNLLTLNVRAGGGQQGVLGLIDDIYATPTTTNLTLPPGVTPIVAGDVNGDLVVNGVDYQTIRSNFRKTGAVRPDGDLNGDGVVEFSDFAEWQFNAPPSVLAEFAALNASQVPEPSALLLLVLGGAFMGRIRTRHHV